MRTGISVLVSAADRRRLEAIVADPKTPQKHVWRARIILLTADGIGTTAIMAATGKSKTCVWRWQERFMEAGLDGLLRDRTRPPGKAPIAEDRVAEVIRLTLAPPPHEATHWTVRAMAKAAGMAVSTVQDIWKAHGLAPHRWRAFKLSNDPAFVSKLEDIVGLYVAPPAHAVVLSIDEKSQIQALDRTQPGLPMKKGRAGTMTHETTSATAPPRCSPRSTCWKARSRVGTCSVTVTRSSSASSTRSTATSPQASSSTRSSTTTQLTRRRRSVAGSPDIRAGHSTSRRHRARG